MRYLNIDFHIDLDGRTLIFTTSLSTSILFFYLNHVPKDKEFNSLPLAGVLGHTW